MGAIADSTQTLFPDDLDALPAGSVVDGALQNREQSEIADYVVIGSGAAGATSAQMLSAAGYSVIILEEGPWVRTREFGEDVYPALKKMMRGAGANMTIGRAMFSVLQGRCVGGGTTINSAIALRAPERVVDRWNGQYGLKGNITYRELETHYDALDRTLAVRPVSSGSLGGHNRIFAEAALKLNIKAEPIRRYDTGCEASASCLTGCRTGRKLGMNLSHVPQALQKGARIYTSTQALKVERKYGRAVAVRARFLSPSGSLLRVVARRGVILAASAVQTPGILARSGIGLPAVGKHFQAHPGTTIAARFDRPVSMNVGATQGYNTTHFVDSDRFKIEALSFPSEMLATRVPGAGPRYMKSLMDYDYALNSAVVVRAESEGSIRSFMGRDLVFYNPNPTDMARLRRGLRTVSEMMFAAGAAEVWPVAFGMPVLKSADDLKYWDNAPLDPRAYALMISHLFGGARMGTDPAKSVVGLDFQVHGTRGLYVMDSSLFPTNIGVNPQHTIMAVARLGTSRVIERPLPAAGSA
ncbi:MAG TPA: GMC family oxidoreductase [Bdellovibrionota bacterium]|nr:GMC family oxidoreductase [Bdellovibrionota bacterium]